MRTEKPTPAEMQARKIHWQSGISRSLSRTIAEALTLPKNRNEDFRFCVDEFKGTELINFRVWFRNQEGEMRPKRKGISFRSKLLSDVLDALSLLKPSGGAND